MNRSILIVIADFLLLSLLTFSTDINHIADESTSRSAQLDVATNAAPAANSDLANAMKQALEDERRSHEQLQQQLTQARSTASEQESQLKQEHAQASQREAENTRLQLQFASAQTNLENLNRQLQTTSAQARQSQEQLAASQSEAQKESQLAAALQKQLDQLSQNSQQAKNENQQLATKLQVAEAEQRAAAERANLIQQQLVAERAEKVQLAEGFKQLATNSGVLTKELRDNRAIAPNTIFNEFLTNRVQASLTASRTGFLHISSTKDSKASTVLVTDGTNIFALCLVQDTPLEFGDPGTDWAVLTGSLAGLAAQVAIRSVNFNLQDPRVVMIPVNMADARQLGSKIYRISSDPYKFQDAVIVGADTGYYGECNFQILMDTPQYVKLDRSFLRGLVGKFNPSRGDLVFSRQDELLGIMVNDTYCLMIHNFASSATLAFGNDVRSEHTGNTLARFYDYVFQLPLRLQ